MFQGFYRYDLVNEEWRAHIRCYGVEVDSFRCKTKDELLKYFEKNSHVSFTNSYELAW
jgi:hypothetical protein